VGKIVIFDTTLRDGEQAPGASLNIREKLEIARQLAALGVDVIEGGFPFTSKGDFEAVKAVSEEVKDVTIAALARVRKEDIDAALQALESASSPRLHLFVATSDIHLEHQLRKSRAEVLEMTSGAVKYAKRRLPDVEFSAMDASRTDIAFLKEVVKTAIDAGATTINIPDTVGYALPGPFSEVIRELVSDVPAIDDVIVSVHCHNDLGLAVANSLAAIQAGARQAECTMNSIGERAGNAALEEIVMALNTRRDHFGHTCNIVTNRLLATSRLVSSLTGIYVQRNKAVVGENAFAHEAGIHQDGILKERITYEIMKPEDVGFAKSELVLGKHSGRHAFRERISELGYELSDDELEHAFKQFKLLSDRKKEIFDADIEAIIEAETSRVPQLFELVSVQTFSGTNSIPTATVVIKTSDGELKEDAATGDGPVDAIYRSIDRITQAPGVLSDYRIRAVTHGKDALGEVSVEVESGDLRVRGRAASTDILEASALAYLHAVNKFLARRRLNADGASK